MSPKHVLYLIATKVNEVKSNNTYALALNNYNEANILIPDTWIRLTLATFLHTKSVDISRRSSSSVQNQVTQSEGHINMQ